MIYCIEISDYQNRQIILGIKKDQQGIEYGCLYSLETIEDAEIAIRNRWKHNGTIKLIKNGITIGVLDAKSV
jgi:hypothetical protein